ncbi:Hypothetical protein, putative [Bodo saltans]|uniref:RIIa domain-containing protein n=1 Tax=Bodo saltans TaxID=75058 RepID=A0A0S4IX78_BODSA|nr:Hypothetical protein, putative [Bodo saltans]|eukprot:CUG36939.1 Hypothetical protein, putative [Bodo saltans]
MADSFRDRTRATRYQQRQALPPNFAQVLKEYTREVLREQPSDVLAWSAQYFKKLALETDPLLAQQPPPEHYAPSVENPELEVMSMKISKVFATMDDRNTGLLYSHLVQRALLEAFGLSKAQSLYILSCEYVNINDGGMLDYRQFARDCVNAVYYFQSTGYEFADLSQYGEDAAVHGLSKAELEDELLRVFRGADEEGLGRLPFPIYRDALINAPLQLTQRDLNILYAVAERTSDGYVEYKKEVDHSYELLLHSDTFSSFDAEQAQQQ